MTADYKRARQRAIVEQLLARERVPAAVCAASSTLIAAALAWKVVSLSFPPAAPLMLAVTGALIGVAVRFAGRGARARFAWIAGIFAALAPMLASGLEPIYVSPGMTLLVVTGGLYLAGLVSAVVLARPILDKDARNAVLMIGFKTCDAPGSNRFVVLVPLMLLGVVAVFVTILLLRVFAFPEIDDPPQPEPIRSPYPEVNGALLGRNWGEYVSEQDCSFLARQHRSNCGDDPMCLEENGVAIDECIKTVRARERNEAD